MSQNPRSQRNVMRRLWREHDGDHHDVVRAYAVEERAGLVLRDRNRYDLSPDAYARILLKDGLRKGWIHREPSRACRAGTGAPEGHQPGRGGG